MIQVNYLKMDEINLYVEHLSNISILIYNNENDKLIQFLDKNMVLNEAVIMTRTYEGLFSDACDFMNYDSLYILRDYGFDIINIHWTDLYVEENENWTKSPLAIAFRKGNMKLVLILMELGFTACCSRCMNLCVNETCILYETFTSKMELVDSECLEKMISYKRPFAVISSFQRYVNTCDDFKDSQRIFDAICKIVPVVKLDVWITRDNHEFVMNLSRNGFVDVDILLGSTMNLLLGSPIFNLFTNKRRFDLLSTNQLVNIIKEIIDLGADIENKDMDIQFSYLHHDLPRSFGSIDSSGTLVDVIRSVLRHESETMKSDTTRKMSQIIQDMFVDIQDLFSYLKSKQRLCYITSRIRKENIEEMGFEEKVMCSVDSSIFSEIMKYIVF